MNTTPNTPEIQHNEDRRRFEIKTEGKLAVAEYIRTKEKLFLTHTEVPKALSGQGLGSRLAKTALQFARDEQLRVVPLCPYMAGYMSKHPEWQDLLADNIRLG